MADDMTGGDSLGVIILSYGHGHEYAELLQGLVHDHGIDPACIVVVHNPLDADDAWSPELPEAVTLVRLSDNRGYAGGMNAGAAELLRRGTRWMLLLTHDARLQPGAIAALAAVGGRHASVGVVGPLLYLENGTLWSAGVRSSGGIVRHCQEWDQDVEAVDRDSIDGTVMLVRGSAFRDARGFDERFFMYWEEADFCLRCTRADWRVVVAPAARALTSPGRSRRPGAHAYLQTRNGLEYARRQGGLRSVLGQGADALKRCVWDLPHPIREKWQDRTAWRFTADRWMGVAIGTVDFLRGRWGVPPAVVRRRSDVSQKPED
jgi:hypothetical protein